MRTYRISFNHAESIDVQARDVTQAIIRGIQAAGKGDALILEVRVRVIEPAEVDSKQLSLPEVD